MTDYGKREDGTPKGLGFFGELPYRAGREPAIATELSAEVDMDDGKLFFPLLVPTLDRKEIDHLLAGEKPTDGIYEKAIQHALGRIKSGKSPFADNGEQRPPPKSAEESMQEGFSGE
jgi:hypothetical protein